MTSFYNLELMTPKALRDKAAELRESATEARRSGDCERFDAQARAYWRNEMQSKDASADYAEGLALVYEGMDLMSSARRTLNEAVLKTALSDLATLINRSTGGQVSVKSKPKD